MTVAEKRHALVEKIKSREGKNTYTQDSRRNQVASGFGDCSSTQRWVYNEVLGIDIGVNTEAQIKSRKLVDVKLTINQEGVPDVTKLKEGDLFFFRGDNDARTKGVGHIEMYIGNGELMGHGSGIGPKEHDMVAYCRSRQNSKSDSDKLKNRGLICVRRAELKDDPIPVKVAVKGKPIEPEADFFNNMLEGYVGISIVDALLSKKKPVTLAYRKTLATAVGIPNYKGTDPQNKALIQALGGKLR